MFRIGSNSKVLTSMAVLHLKDQGLINLDAKFLDILTQYQVASGGDARLRDITIRDLLRHSGGWDRDKTGDPMGWQGKISDALHLAMPVLCPDIIQYMMSQPLDFAPGTKQVYSNFGYCILGRVVEKISGQRYEHYVRDQVLAPMDVHAMSIGYSHSLTERGPQEVKYYDYNGAPIVLSVFPGEHDATYSYGSFEILSLDACGGWIGSPVDLVRAMTAIDGTRSGPFLTEATMTEFTADPKLPDWNTDQHFWYGLGIFVGPDPLRWFHGGSINGTESQWLRDGNGYAWSIMTNSLSQDPSKLGNDQALSVLNALSAGFTGSSTDLFPQFVSPELPPRTK
jgi:N-acyl-D-amino-acid deacylase